MPDAVNHLFFSSGDFVNIILQEISFRDIIIAELYPFGMNNLTSSEFCFDRIDNFMYHRY